MRQTHEARQLITIVAVVLIVLCLTIYMSRTESRCKGVKTLDIDTTTFIVNHNEIKKPIK